MIDVNTVSVGMPALLGRNRQGDVVSGIKKIHVTNETIEVGEYNLLGDGQADLRVHGGLDKAIYSYPAEHLRFWEDEYANHPNATVAPFGENLSTLGMTEEDACIGDIWRWGDAVLQASQPRWPCFKLALHSGFPYMIKWFVAAGRCGWYLRVLEPGGGPVQGPIEVIEWNALRVPVALAFAVKTNRDLDALQRVMSHPLLAAAWRS